MAKILLEILFCTICKVKANWLNENFITKKIKEIKRIANQDKVVCGLSGGA